MTIFDFEEDFVIKEVFKRKAKKILLQLPEGLKPYGFRISNKLEEETGALIYVSARPCYGGCDLAIKEAEDLEVDLIIHYGHAPFIKNPTIPVIYIKTKIVMTGNAFLKKIEEKFCHKERIGLAATVQYLHLMEDVKKILESQGCDVVIPPKTGVVEYPGQILGCEYSHLKQISSKVDCFLLIGSMFHSLGASLMVNKPVFSLDPLKERIESMEKLKNKIIKQRYANISKASDMDKFGILIGTKVGQFNHRMVLKAKELFIECGKKTLIIVVDEVSPDSINNFMDIDVFVNTTCPRIAIDDSKRFNKPILTMKESLVVIGKLKWESLIENGFF